jgi:hypothetical protein
MAKLTKPVRDRISATKFAFPKQRKEPLENASHVRNAAARFKQVKGVTEAERRAAWKRIQSAAKRYGVELEEPNWHAYATLHACDGTGRETTVGVRVVTGDFCTRWNERESTWRKSWPCRSRGTNQSRS